MYNYNLSLNSLQFSCMMLKDKEVESMLLGVDEQKTAAVIEDQILVKYCICDHTHESLDVNTRYSDGK